MFERAQQSGAGKSCKLLGAGVSLVGSAANEKIAGRALHSRLRAARLRRRRRRALIRLLDQHGLLPRDDAVRAALFTLDPYEIRTRGLSGPLSLHELGRAICHLARRRGPAGGSISGLPDKHGTWGAWLHTRRAVKVRDRQQTRNRADASGASGLRFNPTRELLAQEFDRLWRMQSRHHEQLKRSGLHGAIRRAIFGTPERHKVAAVSAKTRHHTDPVVAAARNQVHILLRAMTARFGRPDLVAIERFGSDRHWQEERGRKTGFGRGKPAAQRRLRILKRQQTAAGGVAFCPYTGVAIDRSLALSCDVEIDHIVPCRLGGDNSLDNLVLCLASANRRKAGRTPSQAFAGLTGWPEMIDRADGLPAGNRKAFFAPDAAGDSISGLRGRRSEHAMRAIVNEIRRLVARDYTCATVELVAPDTVVRMRTESGLAAAIAIDDTGAKNRLDHRHHAVDAVAAGMTVFCDTSDPRGMAVIKRRAQSLLAGMIAAAKPRRAKSGVLHRQTVYGPASREKWLGAAVHRKPLALLSPSEIRCVRDGFLRARMLALVAGHSGRNRGNILRAFGNETGIRRLRLLRRIGVGIPVADPASGQIARIVRPMANHHMDIVAGHDGIWHAFGATRHAVRQQGWRPSWERPGCGFKLVMRLHPADAIELDDGRGQRVIRRVVRLAPSSGHIYIADPNAAGSLARRHADPDDPFRWELVSPETMRRRRARAVRVDPLGRILPVAS